LVKIVRRFDEEENKLRNFVEIEGDLDLLQKAADFYTGRGYILDRIMNIPNTLQTIFKNHREFYELWGFEGATNSRYHPNDYDFRRGCDGFHRFMREVFRTTNWDNVEEHHLNKLQQVITAQVRKILDIYDQAKNYYFETESKIIFTPKTKTTGEIDLTKLDVELNNAIIITNDKAYKLQLIPCENIKSINDIIQQATNSLHSMYKLQLQAQVSALQQQIQQLQKQLEEIKTKAFIEGLKTFEVIKKQGWTLKNGKLYFKKKIVAEYIKYRGKIYKLPKQYVDEEKFFVQGIFVDIQQTITAAYCRAAYHCNVDYDDDKKVCLGDLEGKDLLTVLQKLPDELKILNLDSAYANEAKGEAESIVYESEEVVEVWTI